MMVQNAGYLVLQTSIIRFHARARSVRSQHRLATAVKIAFLVTTLAMTVVWALAIRWLGSAGVTAQLSLAGFALLVARGWLSLVQAWNRAEGRPWRFCALETMQSVGGVLLVIVALHFRPGDPAAAIGASAFAALLAAACAPALLMVPLRGGGTAALLRELFTYGVPLALAFFASAALAVSDRLIIAVHAGPAAAGGYAVAFSIADRLLNLLLLPIPLSMKPALFAAWERDKAAATELLMQTGRWLMLIGLPVVCALVMVPERIAALIAGPDMARSAASFIPWLAVGSFLAALLTLYFSLAFQLTRKTRRMTGVVGIPAILNVVVNLWLVPRYGAIAACYTTVAAYALALILAITMGRREVMVPLPLKAMFQALLISAALAVCLTLLRDIGYEPT
jgi:O-antigen/teichoic acid export membrane protein